MEVEVGVDIVAAAVGVGLVAVAAVVRCGFKVCLSVLELGMRSPGVVASRPVQSRHPQVTSVELLWDPRLKSL